MGGWALRHAHFLEVGHTLTSNAVDAPHSHGCEWIFTGINGITIQCIICSMSTDLDIHAGIVMDITHFRGHGNQHNLAIQHKERVVWFTFAWGTQIPVLFDASGHS